MMKDNMTDRAKLDTTKNPCETLPDHVHANGEQMKMATSNMIRTHSVSGHLLGVQPDPRAADILRKEPEHETFAWLKIAPIEAPSRDEVEVSVVLQECLEKRKKICFQRSNCSMGERSNIWTQ